MLNDKRRVSQGLDWFFRTRTVFQDQVRFLRIRTGRAVFRDRTGGLQDRDWINGLGLFKG